MLIDKDVTSDSLISRDGGSEDLTLFDGEELADFGTSTFGSGLR